MNLDLLGQYINIGIHRAWIVTSITEKENMKGISYYEVEVNEQV